MPGEIDRIVRDIRDLAQLRAEVRQLAASTSVSVNDAVLAASELVTNALTHAPGMCRLRARSLVHGGPLRIEVVDNDLAPIPAPAPVPADRLRGRGLLIVAQVTSRWGVHTHDGVGKTVWFEIDPIP